MLFFDNFETSYAHIYSTQVIFRSIIGDYLVICSFPLPRTRGPFDILLDGLRKRRLFYDKDLAPFDSFTVYSWDWLIARARP